MLTSLQQLESQAICSISLPTSKISDSPATTLKKVLIVVCVNIIIGLGVNMMVSLIQKAKQTIQQDSKDSPCYGPLKTADQMLSPAN